MFKNFMWGKTKETLKSFSTWIWALYAILLFPSIELVNWLLLKLPGNERNSTSIEQVSQTILFEPAAVGAPIYLAFFGLLLGVLGGDKARWNYASRTMLKISQNIFGAATWYLIGIAVVHIYPLKDPSTSVVAAVAAFLSLCLTFLSHLIEAKIHTNKVVIPAWKRGLIFILVVLLWISMLSFLIQGAAASDEPMFYFIPLALFFIFLAPILWMLSGGRDG